MSPVPFPLWRPVLLVQGARLDRSEPDLRYLGSIDDPERFGWAILPHVTRSFAASIVLLPQALARAARVGDLYARLLDTYEDMVPDPTQRIEGLQWFATRFSTGQSAVAAPEVEMAQARLVAVGCRATWGRRRSEPRRVLTKTPHPPGDTRRRMGPSPVACHRRHCRRAACPRRLAGDV